MTYAEVIDYFTQLGAAHKHINEIIVGDYDDIIGKERKGINYPALWIESPTAIFTGDLDHMRQTWEGSIVVLINGPRNPETEKVNLEHTFRIMRQLVFRIALYNQRNDVYIDMKLTGKRMEAIQTLGNDNDQGWRLPFSVDAAITEDCYDASIWDETIAIENLVRFEYQRSGDNITCVLIDMPETYTHSWTYRTSSGNYIPVTPFDDGNMITLPFTSGEMTIVLTAQHNTSIHKRHASVHLRVSDNAGYSLPYIYSKF